MRKASGFTLIEIVVVLAIVALLITGLTLSVSSQVQLRRQQETRRILEEAKEAIMGFAVANGRLPCPASAASNGVESRVGVTFACTNHYDGFLPGATLGLSPLDGNGYVRDGWDTRIRYAVHNTTGTSGNNRLTTPNGIQAETMNGMATVAGGLMRVCSTGVGVSGTDCAANTQLSQTPFLMFSLGPNAPTGGTGTDESRNLDGNQVFVSHEPTATAGNVFDDIVTWGSLNTLFSRMIQAGRLP